MSAPTDRQLRRERWKLTAWVARLLETPMLALSAARTLLLITESR